MKIVTFPNTGKKVPLALDVDQFCEMVVKGTECAVMIPIREYKDVATRMMQRLGTKHNPFSFPLICANCAVRLEQSPSFMGELTGFFDSYKEVIGRDSVRSDGGSSECCYKCGGDKALLVFSKEKI